MEGKIAVIGQSDFVMPFTALGLDTFAVEPNRRSIEQAASRILQGSYVLIVIAEDIADAAGPVFEQRQKAAVPCILVLPFMSESSGFATQKLGEVLKMATGVNILQNN